MGHEIVGIDDKPDIQLAFVRISRKVAPVVQRLDGVYFDSMQNWNKANNSIHEAFCQADAVIFQSEFDKTICNNFIGKHKNSMVIHNGTDLEAISKIKPIKHAFLEDAGTIWCCSSRWTNRPNKRLKENIRYFLEKGRHGFDEKLVVIGPDSKDIVKHDDILYLGNLTWEECISVYRRTNFFVHLAFVDHCPNVVIDARACDCNIICSSCSGTKEIAGEKGIIINDLDWNMKDPVDVKHPPKMDFNSFTLCEESSDINIENVAKRYLEVFENV